MRKRPPGSRGSAPWGAQREPLTYANVMSTIAVFGVLAGGGAYAASQIGPEDIQKNAIRAKHIKKNQVRAKHVARNAIRSKHLSRGAVTKGKLADGLLGAPAPPTGPAGGALAGNYPNPGIANGAVGGAQLADDAKVMWALVNAEGEVVVQSGGISVEQHGVNGFTRLRFPSPVQGRAIMATITLGGAFGSPFGEPGIKANACGSTDAGPDCMSQGNANTDVTVAPFINDVQDEAGFYLAVLP